MPEISLRPYQVEGVEGVRDAFARKVLQVLFVMPTGAGKCAAAGTPVLMYDGTIRAIETIAAGELIMGPDSRPRTVLSTCSGEEMMYRVTPTKGDPYVVNESHILSLKITGMRGRVRAGDGHFYEAGDIVNIGISDYLASSSTFKHVAKGWRTGVNFESHDAKLEVPPYILGIWLGDGTEDRFVQLTNPDQPVIDAWLGWGAEIGCRVVVREQEHTDCKTFTLCGTKSNGCMGRSNPARNALRDIGVFGRRHIPLAYKTASVADRLQLLAGIVDTDGYLSKGTYDVIAKSKVFADDIAFLARSLGFACYVKPCRKTCTNTGAIGHYHRIAICGDICRIPCRVERRQAAARGQIKDVLVTGIKVEPIGEGDYYGFEIDGDHLFMLGDFTVTHNTYTFSYIASNAASKGNGVIIIVHRKELLLQASKSLRNLGIDHGMISPHFTPAPHKKVQVASVDTLKIRLQKYIAQAEAAKAAGRMPPPNPYNFKLAIYDEAHHVTVSNKWGTVYELLGRPAMLGVTATPIRGDGVGLGEGHGGVFREMVLGPTVADLIDMGMLINPTVFTCLEPPDFSDLKTNKEGEYNAKDVEDRVDKPVIIGNAVAHYKQICPGERAIVFCASIKHAKHVVAEFNAAGFRFALLVGEPEMSDAERTLVNKQLESGELDGACTVALVDEGYDCPALQVCIGLAPTASLSRFLQRVGRIMRPAPGKSSANTWYLDHVGDVGRQIDGQFKRKHGLPSDHRDWSLEGRKKKKRGPVEDSVEAKQCPKCWHVFAPASACPKCGHDMTPAARQIEQVDGKLYQVTEDLAAQMQQKKEQRTAQANAKTIEDLMATMGYSKKRAEAIVLAREEKAALRDGLKNDFNEWRLSTGETSWHLFHVAAADINSMKPKQLKELREKFDKHRADYVARQQQIDFDNQRQRRNVA